MRIGVLSNSSFQQLKSYPLNYCNPGDSSGTALDGSSEHGQRVPENTFTEIKSSDLSSGAPDSIGAC